VLGIGFQPNLENVHFQPALPSPSHRLAGMSEVAGEGGEIPSRSNPAAEKCSIFPQGADVLA